MAVSDDIELGELVIILGVTAGIIYFLHKWLASATCISKIGTIPGITGASQSQVDAAKVAATNLKSGGKVIWSCGSDFDYQQPCGTVTQARHNPINYLWPWSDPIKYTCVPANSTVCNGACCYSGMFQAGAGGA